MIEKGARALVVEVERLLAERTGGEARLEVRETISEPESRHVVLRCALETKSAHAQLPRSVIVKHLRDHAQASADERRGFVRECAGAEFVSRLSSVPTAGVVLTEPAAGVLVVEDLGKARRSVVDALTSGDPEQAEVALAAYMKGLAALHVAAQPRVAEYEQLLARGTSFEPVPATIETEGIAQTREFCSWLAQQLSLPGDFEATLTELVAHAHRPGPFYTFVHGDACPDNTVWREHDLCWIDFELGHLGSALIDAVYLRAPFPSCWCCGSVPEPILARLEQSYRAELARGVPAARDTIVFEVGMLAAAAHWLVRRFAWFLPRALEDNNPLGLCGRRTRLLSAVSDFHLRAREHAACSPLLAPLERLQKLLESRWPEAGVIEPFPAFRRLARS